MESFTELLTSLFGVNVVTVCSESTKQLTQSKFSCNLNQILSQFNKVNNLKSSLRDPNSNSVHPINHLFIRTADFEEISSRPNVTSVKKLLFETVSLYSNSNNLDGCNYSTPWFDSWKKAFLKTFEYYEHEFIGAFFGCFYFITASELTNYKDVINIMQSKIKSSTSIKWFNPHFLKYYVVLNEDDDDASGERSELYQDMMAFYGASQCHFLKLYNGKSSFKTQITPTYNEFESVNSDTVDNTSFHDYEVQDPLSALSGDKYPLRQLISVDVDQNSTGSSNISDVSLSHVEILLKDFMVKALMPWCERQLRILNDSISMRKGLRRSIFSATKSFLMSSSTINLRGGINNQTIIYSAEANEMQQRKLADLCMSLTLYELANSYYYNAKKEFQGEGAWIYYAGACEMTAITSYLVGKFQKHYFEQAISCYVDTCRSLNLAARATLLATEVIKSVNLNEAATLYIRMTSEDSDLRSALFLEQAAKCFALASTISSSRLRKASFHSVLSGHRYNKCGLKRHALACYLRYSCPYWNYSFDHVNYTVARLYLQIASNSPDNSENLLRQKGLEILRLNSDKEAFFSDFLREIKKEISNDTTYFVIKVPCVKSMSKPKIEGSTVRMKRQTCFVNELVIIHITLWSPFSLILNKLRLFSTSDNICCDLVDTVQLEENYEKSVSLTFTCHSECEFDLCGLEYESENEVRIRHEFNTNLCDICAFTAIKSLPMVDVLLKIGMFDVGTDAVELYTGQIVDVVITVLPSDKMSSWQPSKILLRTNANLVGHNTTEQPVQLLFYDHNYFKIETPYLTSNNSIYFTIEYYDDGNKDFRTVTKQVELYIRECLHLEDLVENVVSLKNVLPNSVITICGKDQERVDLPSGLTAHLLIDEPHVSWSSAHGHGFLPVSPLIY